MGYLKEQYIKAVADKISICKEDLNETELQIIDACFNIFNDRLEDIKALREDNNRLSIENANLIAFRDDKDYE